MPICKALYKMEGDNSVIVQFNTRGIRGPYWLEFMVIKSQLPGYHSSWQKLRVTRTLSTYASHPDLLARLATAVHWYPASYVLFSCELLSRGNLLPRDSHEYRGIWVLLPSRMQ